MRPIVSVLFFLFFIAFKAYSQDILYTTSGNKIKVSKVTEINIKDIKYKDFTNPDGPTYVIAKTDIVLIQYANGTTDVINDNPNTLAPKITETVTPITSKPSDKAPVFDKSDPYGKNKKTEKKDFNLYYLNKNMISINALALANGDITLMYDREILNSRMSLSFLGGYSFNSRMGALNFFIRDSKDGAKKKFDAGVGINLMPRNTKRVQYFVGVMAKYMAYDYLSVTDTTNNQKNFSKASASQLAIMISNGWVFRVTPNFNFKLFGSIGGQINSTPLEVNRSYGKIDYANYPKVYLGYCFGYRF